MRDYRSKYERQRLLENIQMALARRSPRWLKKWVYCEITNAYWAKSGESLPDVRAADALKDFFSA